ncbi:hypothetical protein TNCT_378811 [Trichonephila clavata]|uniref:Uncharacterized protein n=1 Tax=Trichonephila clavata TaxID=2740835 RepID=A0A8X6LW93_TRICU|nr:hypothetical protein TNCT_378811 [Trichonephila clavata]
MKQRMVVSLEYLVRYHEDGHDFLLWIETKDEFWVHHFMLEMKAASMERKHPSSPVNRKKNIIIKNWYLPQRSIRKYAQILCSSHTAAVLGTFFETKTIVNSAHTTHAKSGFPTWYVILIQVRGTNFFGKSATL